MAVRQYVGARYVPKFADPIVWEEGKSYEALTIVTYNNDSYTSKVPTPATVGTPPNNEDYWALTGNFNGQVEEYRKVAEQASKDASSALEQITGAVDAVAQEVKDREAADTVLDEKITAEASARQRADTALNEKISAEVTARQQSETVIGNYLKTEIEERKSTDETLQKQITELQGAGKFKKYILVGDSYAAGYTPSATITSWTDLLQTMVGTNASAVIKQGGGGLSSDLSDDYNLTTKINALTSDNEVVSVICCCGRNDANGQTYANIRTGITNFVNACKAKFPNAIVYIGFIGWDTCITEYTAGRSVNLAIANSAYEAGGKYNVLNTSFILRDRALMSTDGKHPNADGQIALANGIYSCLLNGGTPCNNKPYGAITGTDSSGKTITLSEVMSSGVSFFEISNATDLSVSYTGALNNVTITISTNPPRPNYVSPSGYGKTCIPVTAQVTCSGGHYYLVPAKLTWLPQSDGSLKLNINFTVISSNNYPSETVTGINLYSTGLHAVPFT